MKYYRVLQIYDQSIYWKRGKIGKHCLIYGGFLIGGELFTEKDLKRFDKVRFYNLHRIEQMVEPVEVSRKRVFWSFGARFADAEFRQKEV